MSEKIDDCVEKLLSDLRHFQERQYLKDPIKVAIINYSYSAGASTFPTTHCFENS